MSRRDAREEAFLLLFQLDIRPVEQEEQISAFIQMAAAPFDAKKGKHTKKERENLPISDFLSGRLSAADITYLDSLVHGVLREQDGLDEAIKQLLQGWSFERLPFVDRTLLRMGAYEILYVPEVPKSVSINEMVLMAKDYAAEDAHLYINGVLAHFEKPLIEAETGDA